MLGCAFMETWQPTNRLSQLVPKIRLAQAALENTAEVVWIADAKVESIDLIGHFLFHTTDIRANYRTF